MTSRDLHERLRRHFGFETFLPGQEAVIRSLLAGHSAAAVFPTGGGKSLCYQLPALCLDGTTIVVSPLIALMKDQIDALAQRGHHALRLDSSLDAEGYRAAMNDLADGAARLVYVAPERFNNERFRESISRLDVSLFAVDEAHCISEWGHNFRPDYLKLVRYARDCGAQRVLALTATATERVMDDICASFDIDPEHAVRTPFYRSNLELVTTPTVDQERFALLERRLRENERGASIVYVTRQRTADDLATRLDELGFPARAYHAGKKAEDRSAIQDWFFEEAAPIVVATIAFGMGIDKSDIRAVVHFNLPKSIENYSQEIGRAGRDGEASRCEMFACADDLCALENFVYGDTPSAASIAMVLDEVFGPGESTSADSADETAREWADLSLYALSVSSDMRELVVRTLLTYLELDGYLEAGTPYYSQYEFRPLVPSDEILEQFEGERRAFVDHLLRHASKRRTWYSLDLDGACRSYGAPRGRALRALEYFEAQGWLELRALGVRHRYRIARRPSSIDAMVEVMTERFARRETAEIERLRAVVSYVEADDCRARLLSNHFGEELAAPCGCCSWCSGGERAVCLPERAVGAVDEARWHDALALADEHPEALAEPRALARFLCGITSPRTSKARLRSHDLFGVFEDVPFERILALATEVVSKDQERRS